jgi:hypothetical protein
MTPAGDKTVLTIPACQDLKMKNKQKFNLKVQSLGTQVST